MKHSILFINSKNLFAILLGSFLWCSCGSESQPASPTPPIETAHTTQTAAPAEAEKTAALKFDFEHFGSFDLSTWKANPPKSNGGGDVEIETTVYEKDGVLLEVEVVDKGEYGYELKHTLKGADGKLQKIRSLEFSNEPFAVTETVNDFTLTPVIKYSRTQETGKHYKQMNPLPLSATGDWKTSAADKL
jgi:hypothetical protein